MAENNVREIEVEGARYNWSVEKTHHAHAYLLVAIDKTLFFRKSYFLFGKYADTDNIPKAPSPSRITASMVKRDIKNYITMKESKLTENQQDVVSEIIESWNDYKDNKKLFSLLITDIEGNGSDISEEDGVIFVGDCEYDFTNIEDAAKYIALHTEFEGPIMAIPE